MIMIEELLRHCPPSQDVMTLGRGLGLERALDTRWHYVPRYTAHSLATGTIICLRCAHDDLQRNGAPTLTALLEPRQTHVPAAPCRQLRFTLTTPIELPGLSTAYLTAQCPQCLTVYWDHRHIPGHAP